MNRDPAYSRVYGYGLLDDLHNLFPEILYDSRIFPGEEVHSMNNSPLGRTTDWIRFRISSMFPQTFVRAKASYERNLSPRRREDFERWLFTHFIHPPAPRQYFPPTNVIFQEQTRQQDSDSEIDGIISILNLARSTRVPIVNTLASNNLTGGWLADFFSSILIRLI